MGPSDISIMLARTAEAADWQSVTAFEAQGLWVVEIDAETEVAINVDFDLGLLYAAVDAGAVADVTGPIDQAYRLLLKTNDQMPATGGLVFGLAPDEDRLTLSAPVGLAVAQEQLGALLPQLVARCRAWTAVLAAPSTPAEPPAPLTGDETFMRV